MDRSVVLCTLPMHDAGAALLASAAELVIAPGADADTLRRVIGEADYLLVRNQLPADLFERPHRLRGVIRNGTGLDLIPVAAATAQGIPVANVPGANAQSVAEFCVASFLQLARRHGAMHAALTAGDWSAARAMAPATFELSGKTVGIIGTGAIGQKVAQICRNGFGMRALGYHPNPARVPDFIEAVDLESLLRESDFVSLNCPLNDSTRHLINAARLKTMKRSAYIVNAARGEVTDEAALAAALRDGRIAGAAVDVYSQQPASRDHPLLALGAEVNLILTPHVAALTDESFKKMSVGAAQQILQLIDGQRPTHLVNPEVWASYPHRRD